MIKRTLAVLAMTLVATAASADPPTNGAAPPNGLLDDVRTVISEIVLDIRDGLGHLFKKPRPDNTQCRPSSK
jgi:hypothetical protein